MFDCADYSINCGLVRLASAKYIRPEIKPSIWREFKAPGCHYRPLRCLYVSVGKLSVSIDVGNVGRKEWARKALGVRPCLDGADKSCHAGSQKIPSSQEAI
tara:strand:+ start:166 stop:468 length:303 start_codon:yes stop_codon:yes gene_type:complete